MLTLAAALKNRARTLLRLQKERLPPPRGPKPRLGAHIVYQDYRITVQTGLSEDLWRWLMSEGWREVRFRPDRRRYRDVPPSDVTRLIDSLADDWEDMLQAALANAAFRTSNPGKAA